MNFRQRKLAMRNFVAKFAKRSGAGQHKPKQGPHASRARQKQNWRRGVE